MLLSVINVGSAAAFNAFVSIVVASFYSAFAMSASVLLHKRLTTPLSEMEFGSFSLGRWGIPIIIASLAYTVMGIVFTMFPATSTVTPETMNWCIVVFGGSIVFALAFWVVHGRKVYKGPILEIPLE